MTAILDEIRTEYRYTNKLGATVVISSVPMDIRKDMYGNEHRTFSMGVAMRLEELTNQAFGMDSTSGVVHHLEF